MSYQLSALGFQHQKESVGPYSYTLLIADSSLLLTADS
jgi:hypothetical protein